MTAFHFELVSPEKLLFSGEVEFVVAPGSDGQFTVLANHAPVMTTLKPGVIVIAPASGETEKLFVRGGFADVNGGGFTILAEQAVALKDVDLVKVEADIKDAREDAADAKTEADRIKANEKLAQLLELRGEL